MNNLAAFPLMSNLAAFPHLGHLLIGLAIGGMGVLATAQLFGSLQHRVIRTWCRYRGRDDDHKLISRLKYALSPKRTTMLFPWLVGFLNPASLLVFASDGLNYVGWGQLLGYIVFSAITYPFQLGKTLRKFREDLAVEAAHKLVLSVNASEAEPALLRAANSGQTELKMAAIEGLKHLGTPAGNEALVRLCGDKVVRVSMAALQAYTRLTKALNGKDIRSLADMPKLVASYEEERANVNFQYDRHSITRFLTLRKVSKEIEEITYSQFPLVRAFPDLVCRNCHVFAKMQRLEEWRWVYCPVCGEANKLVPGIRTIVGVIGGLHAWVVTDHVLHASMWDKQRQVPILAEPSLLVVRGGQDIDYDWAISAVAELIANRRPKGGKGFPVELDETIALSTNTQAVLGGLGFVLERKV